jgi:hypothetical protein
MFIGSIAALGQIRPKAAQATVYKQACPEAAQTAVDQTHPGTAQAAVGKTRPDCTVCCRTDTSGAAQAAGEQIRPEAELGAIGKARPEPLQGAADRHVQRQHSRL